MFWGSILILTNQHWPCTEKKHTISHNQCYWGFHWSLTLKILAGKVLSNDDQVNDTILLLTDFWGFLAITFYLKIILKWTSYRFWKQFEFVISKPPFIHIQMQRVELLGCDKCIYTFFSQTQLVYFKLMKKTIS